MKAYTDHHHRDQPARARGVPRCAQRGKGLQGPTWAKWGRKKLKMPPKIKISLPQATKMHAHGRACRQKKGGEQSQFCHAIWD